MARVETIITRVSPEEKYRIAKAAEQSGLSIADYTRIILKNRENNLNGRLAQFLVRHLCEHAKIIDCVEDTTLRKRFIDWEKSVWQSIE